MSGNNNNEEVASCSVEETPQQGPITTAQASSQQARSHEVFGDSNLTFLMMVLILLHLLQYSMRDPCTC